jgi:hypothetical protein
MVSEIHDTRSQISALLDTLWIMPSLIAMNLSIRAKGLRLPFDTSLYSDTTLDSVTTLDSDTTLDSVTTLDSDTLLATAIHYSRQRYTTLDSDTLLSTAIHYSRQRQRGFIGKGKLALWRA